MRPPAEHSKAPCPGSKIQAPHPQLEKPPTLNKQRLGHKPTNFKPYPNTQKTTILFFFGYYGLINHASILNSTKSKLPQLNLNFNTSFLYLFNNSTNINSKVFVIFNIKLICAHNLGLTPPSFCLFVHCGLHLN